LRCRLEKQIPFGNDNKKSEGVPQQKSEGALKSSTKTNESDSTTKSKKTALRQRAGHAAAKSEGDSASTAALLEFPVIG
jgi:hypothetical protein